MRIGVDLGGTKIEAVALADSGDIVARLRVETPRSYDATVAAIGALVDAVEQQAGESGTVGLGIPGALIRVADVASYLALAQVELPVVLMESVRACLPLLVT
jgi:predicted NBD/HSP70 family sugar kinase